MLDLSVFAIGLVAGWSALFLRWPGADAGLTLRLRITGVWLGWALVTSLLVHRTGSGWALVGLGLGLAGHAMLALGLQDFGRKGEQP